MPNHGRLSDFRKGAMSINNSSSTTGASEPSANDSLDLILQKLNATEAKMAILRHSLDDLETEHSEIRQHYENEIARDKDRIVVDQDDRERERDHERDRKSKRERDGDRDRDVIMRDPHPRDWHHEPMAEMPPVLGLDPIRKERGGGDARHPKRLKSEQRRNRNPERKGDGLSVKKGSRRHATPAPVMPSSCGVSGRGESGGAGGVKDGDSPSGGALPQQIHPQQSQFPIATSRTQKPPLQPIPFPLDVDLPSYPPELKIEGSDWFVLFNSSPKVQRVLDVNLVHTLMHNSMVFCVKFSRDGKWVATGSNGTAQIYNAKTGAKVCVLEYQPHTVGGVVGDIYVRSVCFSPDGKYLATGADDKQIKIWDISNKRILNIFEGHQNDVSSVAFSSDGLFIVSGSGDGTGRIWDVHDGTSKVLTIDDGNRSGVTFVDISPDDKYVVMASLERVVSIWEMNTGRLVQRLRGHKDWVYSIAFTPDGKGLVSGALDTTVKYWDISWLGIGSGAAEDGSRGSQREGKGKMASGSDNTTLTSTLSPCIMNLTGHHDCVFCVAVSHDNAWIVSGSQDDSVLFYDARTGVVQCALLGHTNSVLAVDLSPVDHLLATGSGDYEARIWSYGVVE